MEWMNSLLFLFFLFSFLLFFSFFLFYWYEGMKLNQTNPKKTNPKNNNIWQPTSSMRILSFVWIYHRMLEKSFKKTFEEDKLMKDWDWSKSLWKLPCSITTVDSSTLQLSSRLEIELLCWSKLELSKLIFNYRPSSSSYYYIINIIFSHFKLFIIVLELFFSFFPNNNNRIISLFLLNICDFFLT